MLSREDINLNNYFLELYCSLNKTPYDFQKINDELDALNALEYKICELDNEVVDKVLVGCCTSIPANNSFLAAKTCNLILNLLTKKKFILSNKILTTIFNWLNECTKQAADIAFLDILQVTNAIIQSYSSYFTECRYKNLPYLFEKLELRTNVLQPNDVKLWRIFCLESLVKTTFKEDRDMVVSHLLDILYTQTSENLLFHAKVWRSILETLDSVCPRGNTGWLVARLSHILGAAMAAVSLGFSGNTAPSLPEPLLSSNVYPSEAVIPNGTPTIELPGGRKKHRVKGQRVGWSEKETDPELSGDQRAASCPYSGTEVVYSCEMMGGTSSDSDLSDSEGQHGGGLIREQARTRHAAHNLIIRITNTLRRKQLYGYYFVVLGRLGECLERESAVRPRVAALAATTALLSHSKPVLALAQYRDSRGSFTPFSQSLSELLCRLHTALSTSLSRTHTTLSTSLSRTHTTLSTSLSQPHLPRMALLSPTLRTSAALISVSPYHRLQPHLLTTLFTSLQPYLEHKDVSVCVEAVQCLREMVALDPSTEELNSLLITGSSGSTQVLPHRFWALSLPLSILQNDKTAAELRASCWQLIGLLSQCHFSMFSSEDLARLESLFLQDLASFNPDVQLYCNHALNKLLEQILGKADLEQVGEALWSKLLLEAGPLVSLLQSPGLVAAEASHSLANLGPLLFNALKEKEQILVITLLFGCVCHDKSSVRAAAIHTVGVFLLFPRIDQDQFLYDSRDLLVKALSDSCTIVRIKASWALSNLVDFVVNNRDSEFILDFALQNVLEACLAQINGDETVKSNMVRAVGFSLLVASSDQLETYLYEELLDKSVQFFLSCTSSKTKMKTRWNACYAVGTMLRNENIYKHSEGWMGGLMTSLCSLLVSCNNFKVRAGACSALGAIPARTVFGPYYAAVWQCLLDGLDNAANMPDFREFRHQGSLKQHICSTVCHLTSLLEESDVAELEGLLNLRLETFEEHMYEFKENTPPEKAGCLVAALGRLQTLYQGGARDGFIATMKRIFDISVSQGRCRS